MWCDTLAVIYSLLAVVCLALYSAQLLVLIIISPTCMLVTILMGYIIIGGHCLWRFKVTIYTLLTNYSYETVYCCWAESLLLAQISMMYYKSAPKIMFCSEKLGFTGQSDAFLWLIWLV